MEAVVVVAALAPKPVIVLQAVDRARFQTVSQYQPGTAGAVDAPTATPKPQVIKQAVKRAEKTFRGRTIFLRNAVVQIAAPDTLPMRIHVLVQAVPRMAMPNERFTGISYVRPSRTSLVPDRAPKQITVVGQAITRARLTTTTQWLPGTAGAVDLPTASPRPQTILQAIERSAIPDARFRREVVQLRNPASPVIVVDKPSPQIHIISQASARFARGAARAATFTRTLELAEVSERLTTQIHVVQSSELTEERIPKTRIHQLRGKSLVPDRVHKRITIITPPKATRIAGHVAFIRNPQVPPAPAPVRPKLIVQQTRIRPQPTTILIQRNQAVDGNARPHRRMFVITTKPIRAATMPTVEYVRPPQPIGKGAPKIHVISQALARPRFLPTYNSFARGVGVLFQIFPFEEPLIVRLETFKRISVELESVGVLTARMTHRAFTLEIDDG